MVLTGCEVESSGFTPSSQPNPAPRFASPASASVAENTGGTVITLAASDVGGDPITLAITGGRTRVSSSGYRDGDVFRVDKA